MKLRKIALIDFFVLCGLAISLVIGSVAMAGDVQPKDTQKPFTIKKQPYDPKSPNKSKQQLKYSYTIKQSLADKAKAKPTLKIGPAQPLGAKKTQIDDRPKITVKETRKADLKPAQQTANALEGMKYKVQIGAPKHVEKKAVQQDGTTRAQQGIAGAESGGIQGPSIVFKEIRKRQIDDTTEVPGVIDARVVEKERRIDKNKAPGSGAAE